MEHLLYELDAGVGIITLNRPEVANALQAAVKDELTDLLRRIKRDPAVRALMITGAGKVFCAGGDIKTMGSGQSCVAGRERMRQTAEWVRELAELEKPVIAAVNGAAAGAGLGLALACDFMVLSDKAKLACSFSNLALVPDGAVMYFMPRRIGIAKSKQIAYNASVIMAAEAVEMGLADYVVPADEMPGFASDLARRLAARPTYALGLTKRMLNSSFETGFHDFLDLEMNLQAIAFQTEDHAAAAKAFFEKETPTFSGK